MHTLAPRYFNKISYYKEKKMYCVGMRVNNPQLDVEQEG